MLQEEMPRGGRQMQERVASTNWSLELKADSTRQLCWKGPDLQLLASFDVQWVADTRAHRPQAWCLRSRSETTITEPGREGWKLLTEEYQADQLIVTRQVRYPSEHQNLVELRILATNDSSDPIHLLRFTSLLVEGESALQLGGKPSAEWVLYRSGRQKNDLPSVCVLGRRDAAYSDALTGLSETGKLSGKASASTAEIVSDELTVLTAGAEQGASSLLIGFVDGRSQLTECRVLMNEEDMTLSQLEAASELDGVQLQPGATREGEWLRLEAGNNPFEAVERFVESKQQATGSVAAADPLSVFCTWYYYGDTVHQDDVDVNIEALRRRGIPIDVVQIDEGWEQRFGNWDANHRFPDGMQAVAERIKDHGYRPGIWTAPFLVEPRSDMRFHHDDWLLKDKHGDPVLFYMNHTDNMVWDVTHPEVQQWIEELYRKLTGWGYTYHKLDFTRAVALDDNVRYHNPSVTRAEAYRMGIEAVRRGIGPDGYLLICGGLFSPPAGLADAHRTSSDVLSMWSERQGRQGGKVAPYTIKQNVLRYWMNDLWHNDPDALMVRRNTNRIRSLDLSLGLLTDEEALVTALNQYWGGGLVCFSEPVAEIDEDRLGLLRHVVPALGVAAVPRDMYEGKQYPSVLDVELDQREKGLGIWHTVSIVNWEDAPCQATLKLDEKLLGGFASRFKSFTAAEFESGQLYQGLKYGDVLELGELPGHAAIHLRITPEPDNPHTPCILHTNGHFSMGGAEVQSLTVQGQEAALLLDWRWNHPMELLLAAPAGQEWGGAQPMLPASIAAEANGSMLKLTLQGAFHGKLQLELKAH
jgi:hypothetical protein